MDIFSNIGSVQQKSGIVETTGAKEELNKKVEENHKITPEKQEQQEIKKEEKIKTKEELQKLTEQLNKEMQPLNPDIKFSFNDKVDELVVDVVEKHSNRIIRKIPSDEALKIMQKMRELVGILFDNKG